MVKVFAWRYSLCPRIVNNYQARFAIANGMATPYSSHLCVSTAFISQEPLLRSLGVVQVVSVLYLVPTSTCEV